MQSRYMILCTLALVLIFIVGTRQWKRAGGLPAENNVRIEANDTEESAEDKNEHEYREAIEVARDCIFQEKWNEAQTAIKKAQSLNGHLKLIDVKDIAAAYCRYNKMAQAEALWKEASDQAENDVLLLLGYATFLSDEREWLGDRAGKEAILLLKKALAAPDAIVPKWLIHEKLGDQLYLNEEVDEALRHMDRAEILLQEKKILDEADQKSLNEIQRKVRLWFNKRKKDPDPPPIGSLRNVAHAAHAAWVFSRFPWTRICIFARIKW